MTIEDVKSEKLREHIGHRTPQAIHAIDRLILSTKHRVETAVFPDGTAAQAFGSGEIEVGRWVADREVIVLDGGVSVDLAGRIYAEDV